MLAHELAHGLPTSVSLGQGKTGIRIEFSHGYLRLRIRGLKIEDRNSRIENR
jgi:hypothetical protein